MAVANPFEDIQPLLDIERAMRALYTREPEFVRDFACFLRDDRHGSFTFSAERGRIYDASCTLHARRRGGARS